jgi:hypothetical protein
MSKEPEIICKCGHDHLKDWHTGMPPLRVITDCPYPKCDCKLFVHTEESYIKNLEYWREEYRNRIKAINKELIKFSKIEQNRPMEFTEEFWETRPPAEVDKRRRKK